MALATSLKVAVPCRRQPPGTDRRCRTGWCRAAAPLAADQVVGHVQQAGDELSVARDTSARNSSGVDVSRWGRTRLRSGGHDDCVLHHLRLHQAEHLGTEVSRGRSSDAAAGDAPPRRCTPSTRGEQTQISNIGRGSGMSGTFAGSILNAMTGRCVPGVAPGR